MKGRKKSACSVRNDGVGLGARENEKRKATERFLTPPRCGGFGMTGYATANGLWQNAIFMGRAFHVYFMASKSGVLYLGVTGKLARRVFEHKGRLVPGFTQKYNVTKLVWFEAHDSIRAAISREKEIKGWRRARKVALIESVNPEWEDLSLRM